MLIPHSVRICLRFNRQWIFLRVILSFSTYCKMAMGIWNIANWFQLASLEQLQTSSLNLFLDVLCPSVEHQVHSEHCNPASHCWSSLSYPRYTISPSSELLKHFHASVIKTIYLVYDFTLNVTTKTSVLKGNKPHF